MSQKSKPWYLSRELLFSALMLVAGVLQIAGTISDAETFGAGVKAVDWQAWALSAAGLLWGILRIANGISEESDSQPLRGPSAKRTLGVGALLVLGLPLLLGLASCAPAWQDGGMAVALAGQACEPAHVTCVEQSAKIADPWAAEAEVIGCDTGMKFCDLGRRWAAWKLAEEARKAAEKAVDRAVQ